MEILNATPLNKAPNNQQQSIPSKEDLIMHPDVVPNILNEPLPTMPRNALSRDMMTVKAYNDYMDSVEPDIAKAQKEFDLITNPSKALSRSILSDPTIKFAGGLGDTAGRSQFFGATRLALGFTTDSAASEFIGNKIKDLNRNAKYNSMELGPWYDVGTGIGRNLASIAILGVPGVNVATGLMLEGFAQAIDIPGQPGEDGVTPVGITEGITKGAINVSTAAIAYTAQYTLPYVFRGFLSKNMEEILNPKTALQKDHYSQMVDAIEYAQKHNLRLSEIMTGASGTGRDAVAMVNEANFFALREIFKGSDEFKKVSLDMFQDLLDLGKKNSKNIAGTTVVERRATQKSFQAEVKSLREKYKNREDDLWANVDEYMPTQKVELKNFNDELSSLLTNEGMSSTVINAVQEVSTRRFRKGHKELLRKLDVQRAKRSKIKIEEKAWKMSPSSKKMTQEERVAKLSEFADRHKEIQTEIDRLNSITRASPKDLLNSIKLINQKINIPGGNISVDDAFTIRGLRIAKGHMETKLREMLVDSPKALQYWDEAKATTIERVRAFGNNHTDESLILTNAMVNNDHHKVITMLQSDRGLEHMEFIKKNFGAHSDAFKEASSLFLKAKIGSVDGVLKYKETGVVASQLKGDFGKLEQAVSNITPADIKFLKENFGRYGSDLNGFVSLVEQYSNLNRAVINATKSGRGQTTAMKRGINHLGEIPGLLTDFMMYSAAKIGYKALATMPKVRGAVGAFSGSLTSDEDVGSTGWYLDIVEGAGIGYSTGIAARHILEPQIAQVVRVINKRSSPTVVMKAIDKFIDTARRTAGSFESGKLTDAMGKTTKKMDGYAKSFLGESNKDAFDKIFK